MQSYNQHGYEGKSTFKKKSRQHSHSALIFLNESFDLHAFVLIIRLPELDRLHLIYSLSYFYELRFLFFYLNSTTSILEYLWSVSSFLN
jgi:hypothetical protein